jgi:hypothetical protein
MRIKRSELKRIIKEEMQQAFVEEGVMGKLGRAMGLSNVCRDVSQECVKFNAVKFLKDVESGAHQDPRLRVANLNIDDAEAMVMFSPGFAAWTGDDLKRVQQEFGTERDYKTAMAKVEKGQDSSATHGQQFGRMGQRGQSGRQSALSACMQKHGPSGAEFCKEKFGAEEYQARGSESFYESQEELYEFNKEELAAMREILRRQGNR